MSQRDPKQFKKLSPRVYVKYWAPILYMENGKRVIRPMRYRFRPYWAEEDLPSKYSLNTARMDTLTKSKIWGSAFTKHHGLLVFESFLEWATDPKDGKRKLLSFRPRDHKFMFSPVLFSRSQDNFLSFALITDEPSPEIREAGYDRCPIFLNKERISDWLQTGDKTAQDFLDILQDRTPAFFDHKILRPFSPS